MMHIKYSPCRWIPNAHINARADTEVIVVNENTLAIDGKEYVFDPASVEWPDVAKETDGLILNARRDDAGELWVTV